MSHVLLKQMDKPIQMTLSTLYSSFDVYNELKVFKAILQNTEK